VQNFRGVLQKLFARLRQHNFFAQPVQKPTAISVSNALIEWLMPDCVRCSSRAVCVKLPVRANAQRPEPAGYQVVRS
jgi:hypothetical protein